MYRIPAFILVLALLIGLVPVRPVAAAPLCFPGIPGIADCLEEPFAGYWRTNGGLAVFGYPIGPSEPQTIEGRTTVTVQWSERNRLEAHPGNPPPYNVLLGRMGAERLAQLGRDPIAEGQEPGPQAGCRWFPETGHNVCDQAGGLGFKSYWEKNGLALPGLSAYERSLALFGYPLTAALMEPTAEGGMVLTQWFERARFEWHPDKPDQYKVLLGLLGRELRPAGTPAPAPGPQTGLPPTPNPSVFGVEINRGTAAPIVQRVGEAKISWVRYNSIRWSDVEPQPGRRNWAALAEVEAELQAITGQGGVPMVIVRSNPAWARQSQQNDCGAIREAALDDFAKFMGDLAARYAGPPYNIRYWELGNEPDAPASLFQGESVFGCWGDENDPYYGGEYYAEMLKKVYPAIKQANPQAQVVLGGLLLFCDPGNPLPNNTCAAGKFFEGVLRNGGGAALDMVAYHGYAIWELAKADFDLTLPNWKHRGGALLGRLDYLRGLMRQYGVDKPIVANEIGLLCYNYNPVCPPNGFYEDQANYAVRTYTRAWANGMAGVMWYTLNGPGWQNAGLLDGGTPRPGYEALRFLSTTLQGASFAGQLSSGAVLEGYAFRKGNLTYQIYWTNDLSTVDLPLPPGARTVYNVVGQTMAAETANLKIGYEPRIIEIAN